MKTKVNIVTLIFGVITLTACGQNKQVPSAVKTAFSSKFKAAKHVKWDKENDEAWEAEFKMNNTSYSANFSNEGEWMETEHEVDMNDLPQAISQTLKEQFADYEIEEAEISETPNGTYYEFEMEKGETDMEVAIDEQGKVVKSTREQEEDDEDID